MRLAIFGATGRTGQPLVRQALEQGHEVVALVRTPGKLVEVGRGRVEVVEGSAADRDAVARVVRGADAVVSALGPTRETVGPLLGPVAEHVVAAMREAGVERLVWLTGAGVRDERDRPKAVDRVIVTLLRLTQRSLLEDSVRAVEAIRASDLDWLVVRAPRLTDAPGTGRYRVGVVGRDSGTRIPRDDVAAFMLREAVTPTRRRQLPVVST